MFKLLVFVSLISTIYCACQDLDVQACAAIKANMTRMCDDPCIAVICSDTCNNCPLKCYNCENQLNPEDCKTVVQCKSIDDVCMAVQKLTTDFIPLYSSGCETRDVCKRVFGNINIRRRALTLKGGCCDIDKCNVHNPENEPTEPPGYVRTTINSNINPTYPTGQIACTGDDLNATACAALKAKDPNICSKNCIAQKICQGMCQACVKCYKCTNLSDPKDCTTTAVCDVNEKCVTVEELDSNFNPLYRTGCMDISVCNQFFGQQSIPGKRQVAYHGGCCEGSLCNNVTLTP